MFSDSSGFKRGFVEDDSEPSSFLSIRGAYDFSKRDEGHNSLTVKGMCVGSILSLLSLVALGLVEISQNKQLTDYFIKSFRMENDRNPTDKKVRGHIVDTLVNNMYEDFILVCVSAKAK